MNNGWDYIGLYRYKIVSLESSSKKYGSCEICGKYVPEVFMQIEERKYTVTFPDGTVKESYTQHDCKTWFGHYECLLKMRR